MNARPAPALELADVIRRHGHTLLSDSERKLTTDQCRVMKALATCRTAALGGHVETCDLCQHRRIAYNSCRNRHCPKCQGSACARWMEARRSELLPVEYFHVVFTLPDHFNGLALADPRTLYDLLFQAVSETLLEVAANPRHLGAKVGFVAVLHTWGQNLSLHPHVHCVVPGGGIALDGSGWIGCRPGFFLPVRVLSRVFRGKFIHLLRVAFERGVLHRVDDRLALERAISAAVRSEWVVYAKPPFGGRAQVVKYLSRYTHRIAISNYRLVSMDDRSVTFRWKDYARGNRPRTMTLTAEEFLRRFLLHVVPSGFMRIRHFGLFASRVRKENLDRCRELLGARIESEANNAGAPSWPECDRCPICHQGRMVVVERLWPTPGVPRFNPYLNTS